MGSDKGYWDTYKETPEGSREYHARYLTAVNNPIRKRILELLVDGDKSLREISEALSISTEMASWHLDLLERGFCIRHKDGGEVRVYSLTREGRVVEFLR